MLKKFLSIIFLAVIALSSSSVDARGRFAWGADLGTGIDVTGHDMTSIDVSASLGYSNSWINILGLGAGINMAVANSTQTIPVFAIFRTGFSSRPTPMFLDLRGGIAINNLPGNESQTRAYVNPSIGFSLARGRGFHSYLTLGYVYNGIGTFGPESSRTYINHGLSMVNMRIGITF